VWLYLLACQWQRIGQEEAFPGRCAEAGDDLGSVVVTARLARDLMRLCLLMYRRYPPYSKWLGTAFARIPGASGLGASLTAAISAGDWGSREQHMCRAHETVAAWHNELGVTPPLDTRVRRFYERPYQVIDAARFTAALLEAITDPRLRCMALTGTIDQVTDSTDALGRLGFLRACARAAIGESGTGPHASVLVRREAVGDADVIRAITAAAFARTGEDPPEARLVDELRASPAWQWQPHFQVRVLTGYQPSVRGRFTYPEPFDRT